MSLIELVKGVPQLADVEFEEPEVSFISAAELIEHATYIGENSMKRVRLIFSGNVDDK